MINIKNNAILEKILWGVSTKRIGFFKSWIFIPILTVFLGCSDFVEVDPPKNILIAETVFNDAATVKSAMANILYGMREEGMVSGTFGLTTAMGIYSDELDYYGFDAPYSQLYQHTLLASNNTVLGWWSNAYNLIYGANDIIRGVGNSSTLTEEEKNRFMGQALFVRAYMHSLLISLFGDVPYVSTTDYLENSKVARLPEATVRALIIEDLSRAVTLLEDLDNLSNERVLPDQYAAKALLARMYLLDGNWELAEAMASEVIGTFPLEMDLDRVFLKESTETIWQLKPGETPRNTQLANELVIQTIPGQTYALTNTLLEAFEVGDLRKVHWVGSHSNSDYTLTLYFANKYKATFAETESLEYPIVFRSAEQYLIRSEARARLGNIYGAQQDLNSIRNRAGLADTNASTESDLMAGILKERRTELFVESGHRWFDLKRTGNADAVLGAFKPGWQSTDILLPIPESELEINPNLLPQNAGY